MQGPVGGGVEGGDDAPPRREVIVCGMEGVLVGRRLKMFCLPPRRSDAAIDDVVDPRDREEEEEEVPTPNTDAETPFNDTTTTTSTDSIAIFVVIRTFLRSLRC